MFTGLIEETGIVRSVKKTRRSWRIVIEAPEISRKLRRGDSVAVSGVCLTALDITKQTFAADLAQETVQRTSLSHLAAGAIVNLELPAKAGSPLGGHIVQGHVDGVAELLSLKRVAGGEDWRLTLRLPTGLETYVVDKGSITVEGISLTVARITGQDVEIAVIPHTYAVTNLKNIRPGALLNIEVDVLAKYAAKQADAKGASITVEELLSEGF
jgi:riboflavin synthase